MVYIFLATYSQHYLLLS